MKRDEVEDGPMKVTNVYEGMEARSVILQHRHCVDTSGHFKTLWTLYSQGNDPPPTFPDPLRSCHRVGSDAWERSRQCLGSTKGKMHLHVTLMRVPLPTAAVEKQYVFHILSVCL